MGKPQPRKRILVTGGSGFIGKPLVQLLSKDSDVVVFGREDDADRPDNVQLSMGDISNKISMRRALGTLKFDAVYHLAANMDDEDPGMWNTNVSGTRNIVELCKERKIKRLVFMSTAGVLGDMPHPAKESSTYNPSSNYDKSKMEAERIVRGSGLNYTIIRAPIVMGPSLEWYKIVDSIKNGHPLIGEGSNKMHVAFIDDVVSLLAGVLDNEKSYGHIFNIASKDLMTYREFYRTLCKELRVRKYRVRPKKTAMVLARMHKLKQAAFEKPMDIHMTRQHINDMTRNWALSIQKTKDVLGFQPKYTTPAAIHETVKRMNTDF